LENGLPPGDSTGPLGTWGGGSKVYVQLDPLGAATGSVTLTVRITPVP
jgi:hypothetical protein